MVVSLHNLPGCLAVVRVLSVRVCVSSGEHTLGSGPGTGRNIFLLFRMSSRARPVRCLRTSAVLESGVTHILNRKKIPRPLCKETVGLRE